MALRVILNFPIDSFERSVICETLPRINDTVLYDAIAYRVCKVLHPVNRRGALDLINEPVVYLSEPREVLSASEERHR